MKTTKEIRETVISKIDNLTEQLQTSKDITKHCEKHVLEMFYIDIMLIELQINTLKNILIEDEINY